MPCVFWPTFPTISTIMMVGILEDYLNSIGPSQSFGIMLIEGGVPGGMAAFTLFTLARFWPN
jgi:hypothetical protein